MIHSEIATAGIDSCEKELSRNRLQVAISIDPKIKHFLLSRGRDQGEGKSPWSENLALCVSQPNGSWKATGSGVGV